MKKNFLLSLLFLLSGAVQMFGQTQPVDPVFRAVTNKAGGEFICIYLTSEDYFWVDWGSGTAKRYDKGAYGEANPLYPENGLKGSEIKIYGDDITYIIANDCGFTSAEAYMTNSPLWLELSNNPMVSLNIDDCSMLETLIADNCALSELHIGMKKKLQTLNVSGNKLSGIDVSKCSNLTIADISYNNIGGGITLPPLITQFDASGNKITSVDCSKSKKIEYLTLRKNQITSLDLSGISSLIMCDASDNQIADVKFSGNYEYITTVSLKNNNLTSADFSQLTDIHAIDISGNSFSAVDISANKSLTSFAADNNNLNGIDLSNNSEINFLYLCGNKLGSIDASSLLKLHDFRADNNMLEEIKMPQSPDLICVMLTNNNLPTDVVNDIVEILPDVKDAYIYEWEKDWKQHLNLAGNAEAPYADLSKAEAKGWVIDIKQQDRPKDMKGFEITIGKKNSYEFYVAASPDTKVQMLGENGDVLSESVVDASLGMAVVSFESFMGAEEDIARVRLQADAPITGLYAASQMIKGVDFADYADLKLLNVNDNEIEKMDVTSLANIEELICSDNNINELKVGDGNIKKLDCSGNRLTVSTLPLPGNIKDYVYAPQKAFEIAYDNSGILDLSSMFLCAGMESKYGVMGEDGTVYAEGTDYTSEKGIISFLKSLGKVCVTVENGMFPDLSGTDKLRSVYFDVTTSLGIDDIMVNKSEEVYDIYGRKVADTVRKGIYIVNGRKVVVR